MNVETRREKTRATLIAHYQAYPKLKIQDLFKFLYQSAFGCEHLVSSLKTATDFISSEYASKTNKEPTSVEALDGSYSRVSLSHIADGLSADTLGKIFVASSKHEENAQTNLIRGLSAAKELVYEGLLPFSQKEFDEALSEWAAKNYPPIHHSDTFRENYQPSYRVISNEYIPFLHLFTEIDKRLQTDRVLLAIEGGSASGKTTLGKTLEAFYDCTLVHMDDFFLRPEQRSAERFSQIGGNIDWERFLSEVLQPISNGKPTEFRRFDCSSMSLSEKVTLEQKKLIVVEGAYSMHPNLAEYYDLSVFLDISPQLQSERIRSRNSSQMAKRFFEEWIPLENTYFAATDIKHRCDITVNIL